MEKSKKQQVPINVDSYTEVVEGRNNHLKAISLRFGEGTAFSFL